MAGAFLSLWTQAEPSMAVLVLCLCCKQGCDVNKEMLCCIQDLLTFLNSTELSTEGGQTETKHIFKS